MLKTVIANIAVAVGVGAVSGMRSFSMLAFLSRRLSKRPDSIVHLESRQKSGRLIQTLSSRQVAILLSIGAAGELILDKSPLAGDRTDMPALAGRAAMGAVCATALAKRRNASRLLAGVAGAAAAVGATYTSYAIRKKAGAYFNIPDIGVAVVEDTVVLGAAAGLSRSVR